MVAEENRRTIVYIILYISNKVKSRNSKESMYEE